MPSYSWTAKDRDGRPVVREVPAETSAQAKAILQAEGLTELKLMEDEISEAVRAGFPQRTTPSGEVVRTTATDRLKHRGRPRKTVFRVVKDSLRQDWFFYLSSIVLAGLLIRRRDTLHAVLLGMDLAAWPIYRIWMGLPGIYHAKLVKAVEWHRWEEVLELVEKSAKIRRNHPVKVPLAGFVQYRAKALAGLGRLPEALAELDRFENQPGMPGWLHKTHLAVLYNLVRQHDRALEYYRQAITENPAPALYADLAASLVRHKRDTVGARAALAEVDKGVISETGIAYVTRTRGILAYLEGDYALARKEFEAGLAMVEGRNQPFKDSYLSIARAYLCCVLARQGEMAEARRLLAQSQEHLTATGEKELLEEARNLAGA